MRNQGDWHGCIIGMFTHDGNRTFPDRGEQGIGALERLIEKQVGSVMWYVTWDDEFPSADCSVVRNHGAIPHITWELFRPSVNSSNTRPVSSPSATGLDDVLAGRYDTYIRTFAGRARDWGGEVLIRFLHEFNVNWYIWSGNKNGAEKGGPQKVVAVWQYVADGFRAAGADNVKWIWCPHGPSIDISAEKWNNLENYWPGREYVDWIGLDAYNWYPRDPWGAERPYRNFDNCFRTLYDECVRLADKPLMIAEFAAGEYTYKDLNKSRWVEETFTKIKTEYPRIKLFTWFNIKKERDWRVNSSAETLQAFRRAIADDYYTAAPSKNK